MAVNGTASMTARTIGGVFPVLPTIFNDRGDIDEAGIVAVLDHVVAAGSDGVVTPGLASEYDMLSLDEREAVIALIGSTLGQRADFVVGASSDRVQDSIRIARAGAAAGARAAMVMTPRALGPDVTALTRFYRELSQSAGLPIMLQNAPAPMGLGLSAGQVGEIVSGSGAIAWVKEETLPGGQRITALLAGDHPGLLGVFGGGGGRYIVDELARGAIGTMPASETPEVHVALMAAHRAGDPAEVRRIYEAVLPLLMMQAVFRWRLTKEVLRRRGLFDSTFTRAPGPALDRHDLDELTSLLARLDAAVKR